MLAVNSNMTKENREIILNNVPSRGWIKVWVFEIATIHAVRDDAVMRSVTGNSQPEGRIVLDIIFYMKKALGDGPQTSRVDHRCLSRNV